MLAATLRATADEREPPGQLFAAEVEVEVAAGDGFERIVGPGEFPGPPVPHDHVTAAVLTRRDHTFEVEVVEGVVLDVDGHALHVGVERRALGDRPAQQHTGRFEPQVVVQTPGPVPLHDEPAAGRRRSTAALA